MVDAVEQLAFVPLLNSPDPSSGNSRIAVINTAVNPVATKAIKGTIVLSHKDNIASIAQSTTDPRGLLIITSGGIGNGGFVDVIDQFGNPVAGSPFALPTGADVALPGGGAYGQVVFDPVHNTAVISTVDDQIKNNCPSAGACTGFTTFSLTNFTFTPIVKAPATYTFALNPSNTPIYAYDASMTYQSSTGAVVDLTNSISCKLTDINLIASPWGTSLDTATNIVTIGANSGLATALNLHGATFDRVGSICAVDEGGKSPNSVNLIVPAQTAATAVNPTTHQAFMIEQDNDFSFNEGIALVTLPKKSVNQIGANDVSEVDSFIPYDPFGFFWQTQSAPLQMVVDAIHNKAYGVNLSESFMIQVDLTKFQNNPNQLSTSLEPGTCADVSTVTYSCDNKNGLIFYPLPPALAPDFLAQRLLGFRR